MLVEIIEIGFKLKADKSADKRIVTMAAIAALLAADALKGDSD